MAWHNTTLRHRAVDGSCFQTSGRCACESREKPVQLTTNQNSSTLLDYHTPSHTHLPRAPSCNLCTTTKHNNNNNTAALVAVAQQHGLASSAQMPSANTRTVVATAATAAAIAPAIAPPPLDYHHRLRADVEGLVLEIKENLRISSSCAVGALKALPAYRRYPKKYLRNSPYAGVSTADERRAHRFLRQKQQQQADDDADDDPYELLQRLLKNGGLVGEAVRRVQLAATAAASFARADYCYYDSDEESSRSPPVLVLRD